MRTSLSDSQKALFATLFPVAPSRAQRRMIQIVEAAIRNYVSLGVERTTYESIAKVCKVSRPLIQHYFKDKDEIFEMTVKYIRANYQQYTIEAFRGKTDPRERLIAYADSAVGWIKAYPAHQRVWNLFYYYSGVDPRMQRLNTELVSMGHERITALLADGVAQGIFAPGDLRDRAKQIQVLITGAIVTGTTESLYVDIDRFRQVMAEGVLRLAVEVVDKR